LLEVLKEATVDFVLGGDFGDGFLVDEFLEGEGGVESV
jgi:hypothetical protein